MVVGTTTLPTNFLKCLDFTLGWEVGRDKQGRIKSDGGYTNDPDDAGGCTKWGLSERANPDLIPIADCSIGQATQVYYDRYWRAYDKFLILPLNLDGVPLGLSAAIFDTGVNLGVNRSYNFYCTVAKTKDPVKNLLGLRDKYYFDLVSGKPDQQKYYKGWVARMVDLKKFIEIVGQS